MSVDYRDSVESVEYRDSVKCDMSRLCVLITGIQWSVTCVSYVC